MTRKEYQLIVAALRDSRCEYGKRSNEYADGVRTQHFVTCSRVASVLENDNPRLDRAKFLAACGVPTE